MSNDWTQSEESCKNVWNQISELERELKEEIYCEWMSHIDDKFNIPTYDKLYGSELVLNMTDEELNKFIWEKTHSQKSMDDNGLVRCCPYYCRFHKVSPNKEEKIENKDKISTVINSIYNDYCKDYPLINKDSLEEKTYALGQVLEGHNIALKDLHHILDKLKEKYCIPDEVMQELSNEVIEGELKKHVKFDQIKPIFVSILSDTYGISKENYVNFVTVIGKDFEDSIKNDLFSDGQRVRLKDKPQHNFSPSIPVDNPEDSVKIKEAKMIDVDYYPERELWDEKALVPPKKSSGLIELCLFLFFFLVLVFLVVFKNPNM